MIYAERTLGMQIPSKRFDNILSMLLGLACAALFLTLAWPALKGQVYTYGDLGFGHLPLRYFYSQALASGDNFLWSPLFTCGVYLHGDGMVGMYHPLHRLLYGILPLAGAFNVEFLFNYLFLFSGMVWMLSRWDLPLNAALVGAMIFTFSGFNLL